MAVNSSCAKIFLFLRSCVVIPFLAFRIYLTTSNIIKCMNLKFVATSFFFDKNRKIYNRILDITNQIYVYDMDNKLFKIDSIIVIFVSLFIKLVKAISNQ